MDFKQIQEAAQTWVANSDFKIKAVDPEERKVIFASNSRDHISFFVQSLELDENAKGKVNWHVWSDNEDVIQHLGDVQEFLGSCRERALSDILNRASRCLQPMLGAVADDEDYEDDGLGEDVEDNYYGEEDLDALQDEGITMDEGDEDDAMEYFTGDGSSTAVNRLLKDLKALKKSEGKYGVVGVPRGDNLFIWDVKLTDFPTDSLLGQDLAKFARKYNREPVVYMEMKFPKDYPMAPPFVRVLRPRFRFLTGHVTIGGSVCMEMLTKSGWRPTNDIESIMVQIRAEIMSDPNTRLDDSNPDQEYGEVEARNAFERMVVRYGWNK